MQARGHRRSVAIAAVGLCALAFGLRVFPACDVVFPRPGEVRLLGVDAYYHFRHAEYAAESFPHLQRWDLGTHYPYGQRADAAGLFDLTIAAIAVALDAGSPQRETVLRVAAWIAPALGALGFAALFAFARPVLGAPGALLACALYLLSPSHAFIRTALGFSDHHAAEVVLAVVSAAGLAGCLRDGRPLRSPRAWLRAAAAAAPMGVFLFTWIGAPVFLALLATAAAAVGLLQIACGAPPRFGRALARWAVVLGVATWICVHRWPELRMAPTLMDRLFVGCALLAVGPIALERLGGFAAQRGIAPTRFAAAAVALGALACAVWLQIDPGALGVLGRMLDPKTLLIREHHVITPQHYWIQFGPAGAFALAALPIALVGAWRRRDPVSALPALLGSALLALWVRTHDYGYLTPPFVALMAATTVRALLRVRMRPRLRAAVTAAVVVLLLFPLWPFDGIRRPYFQRSQILAVRMVDDGWWESMRWLADHARPLPLRLSDPVPRFPPLHDRRTRPRYPPGSYGVLSAWDWGGAVAAISGLPVRWSRGSAGDPTSEWLLGEAGVESFDTVASMCRPCNEHDDVRYVVVDAQTGASFLAGKLRQTGRSPDDYFMREGTIRIHGQDVDHWQVSPRYRRTMYARLYLDDARGLGHLRLVHETAHQSVQVSIAKRTRRRSEPFEYIRRAYPIESELDRLRYAGAEGFGRAARIPGNRYAFDARFASTVKVFERVAGARLTGTAPAGARTATASLPLRARTTGRMFEYATSAPVRDGRFVLVVPYPTDGGFETAVDATGPYRIGFDGEAAGSARISTAQVERGAEVRWPR